MNTISSPTLLIDYRRCTENIAFMKQRARHWRAQLRPHFKTHQSLEVGRWFKAAGISKITVSSVQMAEQFAAEWDDITIAFPANLLEMSRINALAGRIRLQLLLEDATVALALGEQLQHAVGIFIKVDVGTHRTGVSPTDTASIDAILAACKASEKLDFQGFLAHTGHTYQCRSAEEVGAVHRNAKALMDALRVHYLPHYPQLLLSMGDTPSCSVADGFEGIEEWRPGNFAYYDLMQAQIGSCVPNQIAVAVACPVVAVHADRSEAVIYGGGVHLSKERIAWPGFGDIYGQAAFWAEASWGSPIPGMYVKRVSQEHGIVALPPGHACHVGDVLPILPVHSCMAANLMRDAVRVV